MASNKIPIKKGDKFGRLTVIREMKPHITPNGTKRRIFKCRCQCGNVVEPKLDVLRNGDTKSCGCYHREVMTKHGMDSHPLNQVHYHMMARCYDLDHQAYPNYGGRGIKVCRAWRNDKTKFFEWALDNGWCKGLDLDRENNDKGYSPRNCRFVTRKMNTNNRRVTTKVTIKGIQMPFMDAVDNPKINIYNLGRETIRYRLNHGWKVKDAFSTPSDTTNRKQL